MNSTIESPLRGWAIAQCEVHYCWSTPTDTLLNCSTIHESKPPMQIQNLPMTLIAHCEVLVWSRHSHFQRSTEPAETTKRRYEINDMRWTGCRWFESHHPQPTTSGTISMVHTTVQGDGGQRFRNPCTGEGYVCFLTLRYHNAGTTRRYTHRESDSCRCKP